MAHRGQPEPNGVDIVRSLVFVTMTHFARAMIANAKEWAQSRGLLRQNEVHRADEFRIPTASSFTYENVRGRSIEGSGSGTMEDPDGTLLNFSDMGEEQTVLQLGIHNIPPLAQARRGFYHFSARADSCSRRQGPGLANAAADCRSL